ncbi:MAG: sel1 repeat family protein [Alphaproteobacteria bacterium]|nr:hypothetical protein [Beijerinckiaceae bacterium]NBQ39588.1 sel1 repeat family protein [Alphaproteobacteria bacterium]
MKRLSALRYVSIVFVTLASFNANASDAPPPAAEQLRKIDDFIRENHFNEAVGLTKVLAEAGNAEGEFRLALFYWHGVGVGQNYLEALHWSTMAALSGHEKAMAARKLMLPAVDAPNWPKTLDWARQRLQKTAEAGNNLDLVALSRSYSSDFGFENIIEQYYWGSLSVAVGQDILHKQRNLLSKKIAVTDAAKVQDRVAAWLEKFRKEQAQ